MNEKEAIAKLVRIYTEEQSLAEEAKDIKDEAKESGLNVTAIVTVAKAIVKNKVDELKAKSDEILKAIDISRS
jgi:uncharacterized protein (UPF0335 family)